VGGGRIRKVSLLEDNDDSATTPKSVLDLNLIVFPFRSVPNLQIGVGANSIYTYFSLIYRLDLVSSYADHNYIDDPD